MYGSPSLSQAQQGLHSGSSTVYSSEVRGLPFRSVHGSWLVGLLQFGLVTSWFLGQPPATSTVRGSKFTRTPIPKDCIFCTARARNYYRVFPFLATVRLGIFTRTTSCSFTSIEGFPSVGIWRMAEKRLTTVFCQCISHTDACSGKS